MLPSLPDSGVRGLKSFDAQMMRDLKGTPILVSNDVIRMYLGYMARCQMRGEHPISFGDWMSAADESQLDATDKSGVQSATTEQAVDA